MFTDVAMNFAMPVDPLGVVVCTMNVDLVKNCWKQVCNVIGICMLLVNNIFKRLSFFVSWTLHYMVFGHFSF